MAECNLLDTYPATNRDYDGRAKEKTAEVISIAKQFGEAFFDGDRLYGYGGYTYDGRWRKVVERFRDHYQLSDDATILDVGCAKGFMLHDFLEVMPNCTVEGIDVSNYAIENSMESVRPFLSIASGEKLPYADDTFDLVVSINSIHNLPLERLKTALREIERVSRGNSFITLDAWRTPKEEENLRKWVLTAETMMHVDDWKKLFDEVGYSGDYYWFIAE